MQCPASWSSAALRPSVKRPEVDTVKRPGSAVPVMEATGGLVPRAAAERTGEVLVLVETRKHLSPLKLLFDQAAG